MVASMRERLARVFEALREASPFASLDEARTTLERIMRQVEDELSGVPEDPDADTKTVSDGRMYPPTDRRELKTDCRSVRTFRQTAHRTSFGINGAIRVERIDGTTVLDLFGKDGRSIDDLRRENVNEQNPKAEGTSGSRVSGGEA